MRAFLLVPVLAAMLAGCATSNPTPTFAQDHLKRFAYQLGTTHAALSQCEKASHAGLSANLETARFALQAQAGGRFDAVLPVFLRGLDEPEGKPAGLEVDCECVNSLLEESRRHNLALYREVALPQAFSTSATQP